MAFSVLYYNESDAFLPFDNFDVMLISSDTSQKSYRMKANEKRAKFLQWPNCFNITTKMIANLTTDLTTDLTSNSTMLMTNTFEPEIPSTGCFNITDGKYTIRVCITI